MGVVRAAVSEAISGVSGPARSPAYLDPRDRIVLVSKGPEGAPGSIAYIHSVISRGLGDAYDYETGDFKVIISNGDVLREPGLRNVEAILLHYEERGCDDNV